MLDMHPMRPPESPREVATHDFSACPVVPTVPVAEPQPVISSCLQPPHCCLASGSAYGRPNTRRLVGLGSCHRGIKLLRYRGPSLRNTPSTPLMVSPTSGTHDMARDGLSRVDAAERVALAQARIEAAVAAIQSGSE